MPLIVGRDLNSSIDPYGQRSTFWPLTFSSNAMLPTEGTIDTVVCVLASWSCTMSPSRRAAYCCANAGVADASAPALAQQYAARRDGDIVQLQDAKTQT